MQQKNVLAVTEGVKNSREQKVLSSYHVFIGTIGTQLFLSPFLQLLCTYSVLHTNDALHSQLSAYRH